MYFRQIFDPSLAQYAYLIGCQRTGEALLIDPERDIDRYVAMAAEEDLTITAVTETHIHADYLSGVREFAHRYGVIAYLSDEGDADWRYEWAGEEGIKTVLLKHGNTFDVGNIRFEAVHTPGHTPEHMAFLVTDLGGGATEPMGMASGDFVFVGDLGRPDLLESAAGVKGAMEPSAHRLYGSVQQFLSFDDGLQIWPGHGAGSACGKALGAVPMTTAGYEKQNSAAFRAAAEGEDAFVQFILDGQPEPPPYFATMKRLNKQGPPLLGALPTPERLDSAQLAAVARDPKRFVLDLRTDRLAYLAGHLKGSIFAPLIKSFTTVAGSFVGELDEMVLIVEQAHLERAVTELIRIGLDHIVGWAPPEALEGLDLVSIEEVGFDKIDGLRDGGAPILDVRGLSEYREGHVPGATNISHKRLLARSDEIPAQDPLVVYCRTGERAASTVSLLERMGRQAILVNDLVDDYPSLTRKD